MTKALVEYIYWTETFVKIILYLTKIHIIEQ